MGTLQRVGPRHAAQLSGVGYEIHPGDTRKEALVLGHEADRLANGEPSGSQIQAEHLSRPRINRDQAQKGTDHGCLARPVRSEKTYGPRLHSNRQIAQGRNLAVGLGDVVQ